MVPNGSKWYEMHQNMSLGSHGEDQGLSFRKITTRVRGTNFCTSSERFAPSFVRQQNGRKNTQTVQNALKQEFRGPMEWIEWLRREKFRCDFVARTFAHSARFAPSFVRQPNSPKCIQMVRNAPKTWGGSGAFAVKKIRLDFVARTFALVRPVFHRVLRAN